MPVRVRNLTHRPVLIRLNSGTTLHIAPAACSDEVADGERVRNAKIEKLLKRRVISLIEQKPGPKARAKKAQEAEAPAKESRARAQETKASSKPAARASQQKPANKSG
jgi:hypothetical protein